MVVTTMVELLRAYVLERGRRSTAHRGALKVLWGCSLAAISKQGVHLVVEPQGVLIKINLHNSLGC